MADAKTDPKMNVDSKSQQGAYASGHGICRRMRFAYSLTGPFVAMSVISMGKDLYILEFGASAKAIGAVLLVCSFLAPVMDGTVGNLQDRAKLIGRWFPVPSWGRRAPWFLTHNAMLAPLLFAFFVPPSYHPQVLNIWFTIVWIIGYWCVAACINAFEAARVEIYPFKEERVILEQYCKVTVGIGATIGTVATFVSLTFPSGFTFIAVSLVGCVTILGSTVAVEVLREAKSPTPDDQDGVAQNFLAALRSGLVLRMICLRSLQGIYETIMPSLQLYYFTFVYKLGKEERLYWFGLGVAGMSVAELTLAPIWSQVFARSTKLMLYIPLLLRTVDAVMTPVILLSWKDPRVFVCYLFFWRACNSSYSYWRVAACAWICDYEGRGEGMLLGLFTMVNNLGRALTSSIVVLGLGWAGLVTSTCFQFEGEARVHCEHEKIHMQPESLRSYLEVTVAWVAPAIELMIIAITYEFPIRPGSKMLEELCQAKSKMRPDAAPSAQELPEDIEQAAPSHSRITPEGREVSVHGGTSSAGAIAQPAGDGNVAVLQS